MWKNAELESKGAIAWIANVIFTYTVEKSINNNNNNLQMDY